MHKSMLIARQKHITILHSKYGNESIIILSLHIGSGSEFVVHKGIYFQNQLALYCALLRPINSIVSVRYMCAIRASSCNIHAKYTLARSSI